MSEKHLVERTLAVLQAKHEALKKERNTYATVSLLMTIGFSVMALVMTFS